MEIECEQERVSEAYLRLSSGGEAGEGHPADGMEEDVGAPGGGGSRRGGGQEGGGWVRRLLWTLTR